MTNEQWETLLAVIAGEKVDRLPVGFIIDSPWLPGWSGMTLMDYFASDSNWFKANLQVEQQFPQITFLPGFWSEWGMCTEPSAFGAKCIWPENEFPFAETVFDDLEQLPVIETPDPKTDGLAPFVLKRLSHWQGKIEEAGHSIRFAVARGPLNIAGFLCGNTEILMGLKINPDKVHALLETITQYLVRWIQLQAETFPSIDGIFLLDDVVGFCGEEDFKTFAQPYLKRVFEAFDAKVRFFHNDAKGKICAPFLEDIGVNLFNFAYEHSLEEMKSWTGGNVTLLGNLPPRDVLAAGTPEQVYQGVKDMLASVDDTRHIVLSCGGGMPPDVSTENIMAFLDAAGY